VPLATGSAESLLVTVRSGVSGVGVGVIVGVAVLVGVDVNVGVGVAVLVGVDVKVGVGVAVGEMNVIEPFAVVGTAGEPAVLLRATPDSVNADVPSATVENWIVVSTPGPFGPAPAPVVEQPNVTSLAPSTGGGQVTLRPVEPRKAPLFALTNESTAASQVRVKS